MSRARSKTADPSDVRKKNALPRRLNEKIALMKKKERVESQAFEQAMQSIFEVRSCGAVLITNNNDVDDNLS